MREKELRLALICYGGISLAVYMHGITKEIWRLARASRAFHAGELSPEDSQGAYHELLETIEEETGLRLRVLVDIVAGASAGGINGIFLAQAIASGQSIEPLTDLWLDVADVEVLTDPDARPWSRFSKLWAVPIAWAATGKRGGAVDKTVEPGARDEVRTKLANFVRARWFAPPFAGDGFTRLLLDALEMMASEPSDPPLLPDGQPLDLFVTVTDFHGHPERLRLHSPPEAVETEHRLTISFTDHGKQPRQLGDVAELVFAARATASFPGAFPPFKVGELDRALADRKLEWPGREAFLRRALPRHAAIGAAEEAVLIDGSVLANAPFRPAIEALRGRPARREVDRRFVYIDPKPGVRGIRLSGGGEAELPGFFATILGALSDIPREQPIRDNLDAIAGRSARIAGTRRIIDAIRPEVEAAIEASFGHTFFLDHPTPARLTSWRRRAQEVAARQAGYAYASYGHLKLSGIIEEMAKLILALAEVSDRHQIAKLSEALWSAVAEAGINEPGALSAGGASSAAINFFRSHDLGFRIRRMRFLARQVALIEQSGECPREAAGVIRDVVYAILALYLDRQILDFYGTAMRTAASTAMDDPQKALDCLAEARDLRKIDAAGDEWLAEALADLPKPERRTMLFAYLGFPFYDIATLPLLNAEGHEEFNEIKVDRIAPDDATAIREGGAEATLKGVQFNSFGAFFSRAYRENDYLWGRLHGADRLIDITVSTLPEGVTLSPGTVATIKKQAFRAILAEERERLTAIPELFEALTLEIG
jgi:patatin-related protein